MGIDTILVLILTVTLTILIFDWLMQLIMDVASISSKVRWKLDLSERESTLQLFVLFVLGSLGFWIGSLLGMVGSIIVCILFTILARGFYMLWMHKIRYD